MTPRLDHLASPSTIIQDEGGQTLVETAVSLVLGVLALGFAMAIATGSFRAFDVWQNEVTLVNAFELVSSTVDRDLASATSVEKIGDSTWVVRTSVPHGLADITFGSSICYNYEVIFQSEQGNIMRNGQPINDAAVDATLDVLVAPHDSSLTPGGAQLVQAHLSVSLGSRRLESRGVTLIRPMSAWDVP